MFETTDSQETEAVDDGPPEPMPPDHPALDVYDNYSFDHKYDPELPITEHRERVLGTIESNQVTIIQGNYLDITFMSATIPYFKVSLSITKSYFSMPVSEIDNKSKERKSDLGSLKIKFGYVLLFWHLPCESNRAVPNHMGNVCVCVCHVCWTVRRGKRRL